MRLLIVIMLNILGHIGGSSVLLQVSTVKGTAVLAVITITAALDLLELMCPVYVWRLSKRKLIHLQCIKYLYVNIVLPLTLPGLLRNNVRFLWYLPLGNQWSAITQTPRFRSQGGYNRPVRDCGSVRNTSWLRRRTHKNSPTQWYVCNECKSAPESPQLKYAVYQGIQREIFH